MTRNWLGRRNSRLCLEHLEAREVPATFTVNTTLDDVTPGDGKLSLREAITKANTTTGADVILVPAGVFKIALNGAGENGNLTGDFDITDAVTIQGAGAGLTIIDGQQLDRAFDVFGTGPSSIKVVLQGLTVRNGSVTGDGGGIWVGNADLVVRDCVVSGNRASQSGGGISNDSALGTGNATLVRTTVARNVAGNFGGGLSAMGASSALTVRDSTIRRNIADFDGGGINADSATLTSSTISANSAGNFGGGISAGTATLTGTTVSGNKAGIGGGGIATGTVMLTDSTISGNTAASSGGGIYSTSATLTRCTVNSNTTGSSGGGIFAAATATLTDSTVIGNVADVEGGGISAFNAALTDSTISGNSAGTAGGGIRAIGTATLTNSTVSGNAAGSDGGGIWANGGTLLNCTIVENSAHSGGGLFHNPGGTFSLKNTIVALNLVGFTGANLDLSGGFTTLGHNLIGTGGSGFTNGVNGDIVGTNTDPIDPKLGPLQNNGGRTKTHALLAGSRAIDAGDNTGALATDQRGLPRKKDGNGDGLAIVDIGAFER